MALRIRENLLLLLLKLLHACDRRAPAATELGTASIRRILAISSTALGDTLLSTPGLRSLRLGYPHAQIDLLLNAAYLPLFANTSDIDATLPYHGGYHRFWRLVFSLRHRQYDLAIVFHGNEPQATPLMYLSGARFRFKLPNANRYRFLLSNHAIEEGWHDLGHGIDQRLKTAALAGGAPTDRRMTLPVDARAMTAFAARRNALGIPAGTRMIGLQAGASTTSRRWSVSRFAELAARLLVADADCRIVLTGSSAERALAEHIAALLDVDLRARLWIAAGSLPLEELPALMQSLAVLVTGDTGPMHMALALDTPVVALFAPSDWQRSGPAYALERHSIIQKTLTCDPCLSKRCPYAEPLCMQAIGVDEVEAAVLARLSGAPGTIADTRPLAERTS